MYKPSYALLPVNLECKQKYNVSIGEFLWWLSSDLEAQQKYLNKGKNKNEIYQEY